MLGDRQAVGGLGIEDMIGDKRADILRLVEQYGASNVRVFGSVARGEATPDSDIDLLITMPPDRNMFDLVGLWQALQTLLERDVSLITDGDYNRDWLSEQALEEAVAL